ncbi:MAG: hypothetical protein M3Q45_09660, partial [Chloroflexota bacterium]|nr:hypothetical protein [Chloroflexota bacterium]
MKKPLNEAAVANELRGQSRHFQGPSAPAAESTETPPRKRKVRETTTTTNVVVVEPAESLVESLSKPVPEIPEAEATPM